MKTVSQRTIELDAMTLDQLVTLYLSYTKASAKRIAVIKNMDRDQLYDCIFNYELGAALVDFDN